MTELKRARPVWQTLGLFRRKPRKLYTANKCIISDRRALSRRMARGRFSGGRKESVIDRKMENCYNPLWVFIYKNI